MLRRLGFLLLKICAAFMLCSLLAVASLRWLEPPASAFMLRQLVLNRMHDSTSVYVYHHWVDWRDLPVHVPLAAVAAEDQRFPHHYGFDLVEIRKALDNYAQGERLRGASTISQQLAKNLFLWPERDPLRKGLELWFTLLLELMLPKRRILELYLNFAEFGPRLYGVGAASRQVFGKPASRLSRSQASLMAAVLPNPLRYRLDAPSAHVRKRAQWIRGQMRNLGDAYLKDL